MEHFVFIVHYFVAFFRFTYSPMCSTIVDWSFLPFFFFFSLSLFCWSKIGVSTRALSYSTLSHAHFYRFTNRINGFFLSAFVYVFVHNFWMIDKIQFAFFSFWLKRNTEMAFPQRESDHFEHEHIIFHAWKDCGKRQAFVSRQLNFKVNLWQFWRGLYFKLIKLYICKSFVKNGRWFFLYSRAWGQIWSRRLFIQHTLVHERVSERAVPRSIWEEIDVNMNLLWDQQEHFISFDSRRIRILIFCRFWMQFVLANLATTWRADEEKRWLTFSKSKWFARSLFPLNSAESWLFNANKLPWFAYKLSQIDFHSIGSKQTNAFALFRQIFLQLHVDLM